MIQLYPLSLAVLATVALLSFLEVYKVELSFLLRFKQLLRKHERTRQIIFYSILLMSALMLFFPLYPGPRILGDLIPSLILIYAAFFIRKMDDESDDVEVIITGDLLSNSYFRKGLVFSICFFLHLLFPSFIMI